MYRRYAYSACRRASTIATRRCAVVRWQSSAATINNNNNNSKPFDKVLIANRGEIVQRVIRTCQELDIKTVALYSTADAKAPFVQQADEAVCVGPAAANLSYLNVANVLKAIKDTGAQAVHPGYGFLSENAQFAQTITDAGAVWLGPPPQAVHKMGDKLISKQIAEQAGVHTVPGYDGTVDSIEQALQLCNESIGYPVLLKAAAGGGGKGMRVCYNDQDIKESWNIAKSEGLKFFSDDRLLLEKFIENPHHIEFQVLCSADEVTVFPERECSIQRRNQKVIEESPSCLLTEETRRAMAKQVEALCKAVGYQSAGTVEFLVDKNQHFFFLEMNTRLQVEHPITESICGVDLVKGMLWVGAGWGLPPELSPSTRNGELLMPHKGHAIEARIYAEDPLRGFLPSTGPLTPYVEPSMDANTPESYLRLDSGVAPGHVVSPHYDPMLSKIVYYAPDRAKAIAGLSNTLDEYVIEGVQHNARLVQAVLRHNEFKDGNTPTSFLPRHFPDGFKGVQLTDLEQEDLAVSAAWLAHQRNVLIDRPPLAASTNDLEVVVCLGGLFGEPYKVMLNEESNSATVTKLNDENSKERTVELTAPILIDEPRCLAKVSLDNHERGIQVLRENDTGEMNLQMFGAQCIVLVQSPREYELSKHMKPPPVHDTSSLVASPMPGALISYAINDGDRVELGQELCIIEAMKMQNIIRSPKAGVIKKCLVPVGSSLKADQIILEFEKEDEAKE